MTSVRASRRYVYLPLDAETHRWELYLTTIGKNIYQAGESYPLGEHPSAYWFSWKGGRRLPDFTMLWIVQGNGVIEFERRQRLSLREGDRVIIPPGLWHRYRPEVQTGWTEAWFCLNGAICHRLCADAVIPDRIVRSSTRPDEDWKSDFISLLNEVTADDHNHPRYGFKALALFSDTLGARSEASASHLPGKVDLILGHVRENAHRPLLVSELAKRFGLSVRTLERRFKEAGLPTLRRQIMEARVQRAEALMSDADIPLKQVAYAAGFKDQRRMYEAFKTLRGQSPSEVKQTLYSKMV